MEGFKMDLQLFRNKVTYGFKYVAWNNPSTNYGTATTLKNRITSVEDTLGSHLEDNAIDAHAPIPACRAWSAVNQSIPVNIATPIALESTKFDTDNIHSDSVNNSRFTIKTPGIYLIIGQIRYADVYKTNIRAAQIRINGSTIIANVNQNASITGTTGINIVTLAKLNVGDYIELCAFQNASEGALNVLTLVDSPILQIVKVG